VYRHRRHWDEIIALTGAYAPECGHSFSGLLTSFLAVLHQLWGSRAGAGCNASRIFTILTNYCGSLARRSDSLVLSGSPQRSNS